MAGPRPDTWMPLYVADYLADTTHLPDAEAHGAYLLLLMTCWKRGGVLPDDDYQWQSIARLSAQRWKVLKGMLRGFFRQEPDGTWTQKRVSAELARARKNMDERSKAGSKGASNRWQTDSKPIANVSQTDGPSPSPSPSPIPSEDIKKIDQVVKGALRARKGTDFSDERNRQAYARSKIAPAIGWEVMMAAEDPTAAEHKRAVELAKAEARRQSVMWKPPVVPMKRSA